MLDAQEVNAENSGPEYDEAMEEEDEAIDDEGTQTGHQKKQMHTSKQVMMNVTRSQTQSMHGYYNILNIKY